MELSMTQFSQAKALSTKLGHRDLGFCSLNSNGVRALSLKNNLSFVSSQKRRSTGISFTRPMAVQSDVLSPTSGGSKSFDTVKLFVGLPKDPIPKENTLTITKAINSGLGALKLTGVDGVELPIWWGVVEGEAMGQYDWSEYLALAEIVQKKGLKLHVSLCFHGSKHPKIPLPKWVSEIGRSNPDIFFTDFNANHCKECLSLAVDEVPVLDGLTPVQVYRNFCESFKKDFLSQYGSIVKGITIGLGPNGELRYPSDQKMKKRRIPGVGEFQCYDKYTLKNLKNHAEQTGNTLWGLTGPHDAPTYNQSPNLTGFFNNESGSWESPYGDFFLSWYSDQLLSHADRLLSMASSVFEGDSVNIYGNLPLVHAWHDTRSHGAELAAGFYNTCFRNGYDDVAKIFAKHSCSMILAGMDLSDGILPAEARSRPATLFRQISLSCRRHGVELSGQDGTDSGAIDMFEQIKKNLVVERSSEMFTYQRMGDDLFSPWNYPKFMDFAMNIGELRLQREDGGEDFVFSEEGIS